jgi:glycogen debranching enzyme
MLRSFGPLRQCSLVRLQPRSDTLYVSRGRTVLATGLDGQIRPERDIGLFVRETRLLSRCEYRIDGQPIEPSALSNIEQHTWLGYYFCRAPGTPVREADRGSGMVPLATEETLELRVFRRVGEGLHEDLQLTNFGRLATAFTLGVRVEADFADYIESGGERLQHGRSSAHWNPDERRLSIDYEATAPGRGGDGPASFSCGMELAVREAPGTAEWREGGLTFGVALSPHGTAHVCIVVTPVFEGCPLPVPQGCYGREAGNDFDDRRRTFVDLATSIDDDCTADGRADVVAALQQARADLASLRLFDLDDGRGGWVPAAGLPGYVALFGRDALTVGWQAALAGPEMMQGTLEELARWVGRRDDPWRDEQPGKLLHEAHTGPTSLLNKHPRARYYGSITTSGFYPVVLAELWHWAGNRDLVERLLPTALGGLEWLDRDAARDGFYEYLTRSVDGVKHQAWKDSRDAIVDHEGHDVEPPIATCEEQAFVYVAKLHLAEVCWWLDRKDDARRLWRDAHDLKRRFNERYWMESDGFYAMGLGPDGDPIRTIASNPGHCLAAGIVDAARAVPTADRLMADDLFSGWGIRTLSAHHPAFNPYSYHRGSVWPVEQASFALGFARYGLHDHLTRLARAVFDAATVFEHSRVPELFSGHARTPEQPFPALYPQGNSPQAWSSSALFQIVQALLGLYPYAPLRALLLDPHLPEWLPSLTLRGLRVGDAAVDLRFERDSAGRTDYRVLETRGTLHVVRQPSPWSLTAGVGERIRDVIESLLPGH